MRYPGDAFANAAKDNCLADAKAALKKKSFSLSTLLRQGLAMQWYDWT